MEVSATTQLGIVVMCLVLIRGLPLCTDQGTATHHFFQLLVIQGPVLILVEQGEKTIRPQAEAHTLEGVAERDLIDDPSRVLVFLEDLEDRAACGACRLICVASATLLMALRAHE
jgi:hypothetical protein